MLCVQMMKHDSYWLYLVTADASVDKFTIPRIQATSLTTGLNMTIFEKYVTTNGISVA